MRTSQPKSEFVVSLTRIVSLAAALAAANTLTACTTAPTMPMGAAATGSMASPDHRAAMQAQTKTMHDMHTRMMNAKTPEERQAMMAEHLKAMQGGMGMMKGMDTMDKPMAMPAEMGQHHDMMTQHMAMMPMMMDMMAQRMPAAPAKP